MNKLILAIILSMAPISELRGGMPLGILYAQENNLPLLPIISLVILANIVIIFFIFFFLDNFHNRFMKIKAYERFYLSYLKYSPVRNRKRLLKPPEIFRKVTGLHSGAKNTKLKMF